jgi:hypothetical protein
MLSRVNVVEQPAESSSCQLQMVKRSRMPMFTHQQLPMQPITPTHKKQEAPVSEQERLPTAPHLDNASLSANQSPVISLSQGHNPKKPQSLITKVSPKRVTPAY